MIKRSCDLCRKRKIRCVLVIPKWGEGTEDQPDVTAEEDNAIEGKAKTPCEGCMSLQLECTYEQERKRRGRPNSFLSSERKPSSTPVREDEKVLATTTYLGATSPTYPHAGPSQFSNNNTTYIPLTHTSPVLAPPLPPPALPPPQLQRLPPSLHQQPQSAVRFDPLPPTAYSTFHLEVSGQSSQRPPALVISPESDEINAQSAESWSIDFPLGSSQQSFEQQTQTMSTTTTLAPAKVAHGRAESTSQVPSYRHHPYRSSQNTSYGSGSGSLVHAAPHPPIGRSQGRLRPPSLQVEDVTDWSTLSFFMSLYIRHLHALVPLVHKPTFSQNLTMRLDQRDVGFRAFLFSLMTYVICQSPMSRMIQRFTQEELELLQKRAHKASQQLQDRRYRNPTVMQITTLMCDSYLHAACDRPAQTAAVLGEAIQLTYVMKLNDEAYMSTLGLSCIELEMRRRLFWHLHAIDITWASAGMPLHMNEYEGVPEYPMMIDDEYITSRGAFDQPPDSVSFLVGFVQLSKIFKIFAECLLRHRRFTSAKKVTLSDRQDAADWINDAADEVNNIMNDLPSVLKDSDQSSTHLHVSQEAAPVFSMQTANLFVTSASVNFAFCDFKAAVDPDSHEVFKERERVGQEMYHMLASLSLDSLAANGESMRGKVLRIIQALNQDPEQVSDSLKNWWDMFSMIQFVQMIPYQLPESLMPSRAATPLPEDLDP